MPLDQKALGQKCGHPQRMNQKCNIKAFKNILTFLKLYNIKGISYKFVFEYKPRLMMEHGRTNAARSKGVRTKVWAPTAHEPKMLGLHGSETKKYDSRIRRLSKHV